VVAQAQEGFYLSPLGWAVASFIGIQLFSAGMVYMRVIQLEKALEKRDEQVASMLAVEKKEREREDERNARQIAAHERDAQRHSLDAPEERAMLFRHDRELARRLREE
jgi:hypothetical protein